MTTIPLLANPMPWADQGHCKDDPELFFPDNGDHQAATIAKTICSGCPVRDPCLGGAIAHNEEHGIWGSTSQRERQRLRRLARRAGWTPAPFAPAPAGQPITEA